MNLLRIFIGINVGTAMAFAQIPIGSPTPKPGGLRGSMLDQRPSIPSTQRGGTMLDQRPGMPSNTPSKGTMLDRGGSTFINSSGLPFPIEGHAFTLTELNQFRAKLIDTVVWVKVSAVGDEPEQVAGGFRLFVGDSKSDGTAMDNYSYVYFPAEGAQKMHLLGRSTRGALSFYLKVSADTLTAVGRSRNIDSFSRTFVYVW